MPKDQGLRTARNKLLKTSYKALNKQEKAFMKLTERLEMANKTIDYCFSVAPRNGNNGIDWVKFEQEDKEKFNLFCLWFEERDKLERKINNLVTRYNLNKYSIFSTFQQTQFYGGSF